MPNDYDSLASGQDSLQQLNPGLYNRIKPHIEEIVKELNNQELTDDMIDAAVDEIMRAMDGSNENVSNEIAIPAVSYMYPRGNMRYRQNYWRPNRRWRRYGRGMSTEDLIRLLLLREMGYFWV